MDKKKPTDDEIRQTWVTLSERKGQPATFEEVVAITGGNATRVNNICGECRAEYERGRHSTDDLLKRKLLLHFERLVVAAIEHADERVRTLQSANASALDMISRERNGLREQLEASLKNVQDLGEQARKLAFDLEGARKDAAALTQASGELNAKIRELLQGTADQAKAMATKDATIAALQAQLHAQAEGRLKLFHDQVEAAVARIAGADGPRRKAGLK